MSQHAFFVAVMKGIHENIFEKIFEKLNNVYSSCGRMFVTYLCIEFMFFQDRYLLYISDILECLCHKDLYCIWNYIKGCSVFI
jgi:hypothetical protein